ncbi:MAG TPA: hypothetical protein PKD26_05195 [Pyrinomonadaceae bacterium]|nr:hypothetical protein [Pyrinomonadaceae bacterium]
MIPFLLMQIAPSGSAIGGVIAIAFLLTFIGIAYVSFKALKRTVSMAFRVFVVGAILLTAVIGSVVLWYYGSGGTPKLKPPVEKRR